VLRHHSVHISWFFLCLVLIGLGGCSRFFSSRDARTQSINSGVAIKSTLPAPTITQLAPIGYFTRGGHQLSVEGKNFRTGVEIRIGGVVCSSPSIVTSQQATCILPPHSPETLDVTVTNSDGQSFTLSHGFTYSDGDPFPLHPGINLLGAKTVGGTSCQAFRVAYLGADLLPTPPSTPVTVTVSLDKGAYLTPMSIECDLAHAQNSLNLVFDEATREANFNLVIGSSGLGTITLNLAINGTLAETRKIQVNSPYAGLTLGMENANSWVGKCVSFRLVVFEGNGVMASNVNTWVKAHILGHAKIFSDASCTHSITEIEIPHGDATVLYLKDDYLEPFYVTFFDVAGYFADGTWDTESDLLDTSRSEVGVPSPATAAAGSCVPLALHFIDYNNALETGFGSFLVAVTGFSHGRFYSDPNCHTVISNSGNQVFLDGSLPQYFKDDTVEDLRLRIDDGLYVGPGVELKIL